MMDEEGPPPRKHRVTAHPLGAWDVGELREYVAELHAEIARAEAAIAKKTDHRQAADAFFRLPGAPT